MKLRDSFWSETLPCLLGIGAMFLFLVEGNLSAGITIYLLIVLITKNDRN